MIINTVLFDLDGTLVDTMRLQPYLINKYFLSSNKHDKLSFSEVQRRMAVIYYLNHFTWFKLKTLPLLRQQFQINYLEIFFKAPIIIFQFVRAMRSYERIFPNVQKNLERLKFANIKIGLVTNSRNFEIKRKVNSILPLFDEKITASDVTKKKPNPEMLLKCIKNTKSQPKTTLYVGDTLVDMIAASNAHCNFALVATGTFGVSAVKMGLKRPEYVFNNTTELVDWILSDEHMKNSF